MTTNPFDDLIAAARAREAREHAEQQQRAAEKAKLEQERHNALKNERLRRAIKARIYEFKTGLVASLANAFNHDPKSPTKPWRSERIFEAGQYVVYLTTPYVGSSTPAMPTIEEAYAQVIRDRFVWGLLLAEKSGDVQIPARALVGQAETWFDQALAEKRPHFDKWWLSRHPVLQEEENEDRASDDDTEESEDPRGTPFYTTSTPTVTTALGKAFETARKARGKQAAKSAA